MNHPTHFAPRYEELFNVSDCLQVHRDVEGLLRVLPFQLHPVLDFDYMSLFLNRGSGNEANWYVLDDEESILTVARDVPIEQAHVSWAFEHQQPAVVRKLDHEVPFSGSRRLLSERGLQSGWAVPITTAHRRIGAMFLGSESHGPCSDEELRFLSIVADRVARAVDGVLRHDSCCNQGTSHMLNKDKLALREEGAMASMFEEIVGSSDALNRVLTHVTRVAPTDATVLITGESGTGKELIAHAIHRRSNRSRRPFMRVNCAAIPPSLIASELFGYERGAFTGATQRHIGRFEVANGGTIFLDEIGEIPAETQIALLRVLQEREIQRVGGTQSVPVDVRVLAATNCDLRAAVNTGTFRLDLFYRLNVFPVEMPALRERPEDILLLATYFIGRYASKARKTIRSIERKTVEWLQNYDWPGNIRELQNVVERAVILCDGETIAIDEAWVQPGTQKTPKVRVALSAAIVNQEKKMIEAALEETKGRISGPSGAAIKLGIPRTTLESKIRSLQINKYEFKCA